MSTPLVHAFFVGRAIAEIAYERLEAGVSEALSELGKFDAEQRENLRQFVDEVMERAQREETIATQTTPTPVTNVPVGFQSNGDLQATIDDLRAEIAELRSELQRYRTRANS
jgi:polyhydroxyalkanoate synthesis regulator phasin